MSSLARRCPVVFMAIGCLGATAAAQSYTITELPKPTAATTSTDLLAFNNQGNAVGVYREASGNRAYAYVNGVSTPIDSSGNFAEGYGINDLNHAVGLSLVVGSHGFLYQGSNPPQVLSYGLSSTRAQDINNSGVIVGSGHIGEGFHRAAVLTAGVWTGLSSLAASPSLALAINNSGVIAGRSNVGTGVHAVYWGLDRVIHDIGNFGRLDTQALDLNDAGQVVGYGTTATGERHAFLFSGGSMIDLGMFEGQGTFALGINTQGDVTGFLTGAGDVGTGAFLYKNGSMVSLQPLIDPASGWQLLGARDINDSGQILCIGLKNGSYNSVILTPVPEPASILGLALGALALRRRRR
jgi:probable HAF family extracellular repeat protein